METGTQRVRNYEAQIKEFRTTFGQRCPRLFCDCESLDANLQGRLINEEGMEYHEATTRAQIVDGLTDLLYVTVGGFVACGIKMMPVFILPFPSVQRRRQFLSQIARAVNELCKPQLCQSGITNSLQSLYEHIEDAASNLCIDIEEAFRRVHKSNMTKAWTSPANKPAGTTATMAPNGLWIIKDSGGKVIKSPDYTPVNLEGL